MQNVDEINDIMTGFLDNLVEIAKIHTEFKEALGEEHEYTKLAKSLVSIFNQYQSFYVYIKDEKDFANLLTKVSKTALKVLSFKPYELLEGSNLKRKKQLKDMKKEREEALKELSLEIDNVNLKIDEALEERKKDEKDNTEAW